MTTSSASSTVMPLCARSLAYSSANCWRSGLVAGSTSRALARSPPSPSVGRVMPSAAALRRIASGSPNRVRSQMLRRSSTSAARSTRSSVPSGSTTCRLAALARSSSACSNIIGVTRSDRLSSIRLVNSAVSTCSSNRPRAISAFRGLAWVSLPSRWVSAAAVSQLPSGTTATGVPGASRAASAITFGPGC